VGAAQAGGKPKCVCTKRANEGEEGGFGHFWINAKSDGICGCLIKVREKVGKNPLTSVQANGQKDPNQKEEGGEILSRERSQLGGLKL